MNAIKDVLTAAGRLDDVLNMIHSILENLITECTYPVLPTRLVCDGSAYITSVSGQAIVDGLNEMRDAITADDLHDHCMKDFRFTSLEESITALTKACVYVDNANNIDLHNYANTISHRLQPAEIMEHIRVRLILAHIMNSLIQYYYNLYDEQSDPCVNYYIPDGWKAMEPGSEDVNDVVDNIYADINNIQNSMAILKEKLSIDRKIQKGE